MNELSPYIMLIIGLIVGAAVVWFIQQLRLGNKIQSYKDEWSDRMQGLQQEASIEKNNAVQAQEALNETKALLNAEREKGIELHAQLASSSTAHENLQQKLDAQTKDLENIQEKFKSDFEVLANKILEEKTEKFTAQNKLNMAHVLEPLKEKITDFEKKVENTHKESLEKHASLKEQILGLTNLNKVMSDEAKNLARALKGDSKTQGNWGELILERVLEKSGLEKGREYDVQQSFTNENGTRMQPDVIIHMPDRKKMVVDSKVSLTAYDELVASEDDESRSAALKAHILSIRNHAKNLTEKKYHDIYQIESPDFVLMFIPIETAFSSAISEEPSIYTEAFDKNIVIVTPSTLLATLKTIDSLWQHEKQKRYSLEIASEAGKMYDKFVNLLEDLRKVGEQLNTTKKSYDQAMTKVYEGRGDLITRAEKLKKLGAKASKQIDPKMISRSEETN